jgi:hypothetical protein
MPDRYVQPTGVDVTNPSPTTPPPTAPLVYSPLVEPINTVAAAGAAQTLPDPTAGSQPQSVNRLTLTAANCALTFPTPVAGKSMTLVLIQDATGGRTVTWPATVKWSGGIVPVLSTGANKVDYFTFLCTDGSTWTGFIAGQDVR